MQPQTALNTDVLISGGGISGAVCAALLGRLGLRVTLIRTAPPSQKKPNQADVRILAITLASQHILSAAGVWKTLSQDQIGLFKTIQVSDAAGSGTIQFDSATIGQASLGYIIPYRLIQAALETKLAQQDTIDCIQTAAPVAITAERDRITASLNDGRRVQARLVVGADGAHSPTAALAGIDYARHDYRQHAIAAIVKTKRPHQQTARQRFLATGPLAFLPMADSHTCAIVWSTSPEQAERLLETEATRFNNELATAFRHATGDEVRLLSPRARFPLFRAQARRYCQPRLALIGDAAHSIHPLAGQGANLGLLDAAALATLIGAACRRQRDIGQRRLLRKYERWRRSETCKMMKMLDGLKQLFENSHSCVQVLRNAGLNQVDRMPLLKALLMQTATGLTEDRSNGIAGVHHAESQIWS